MADQLTSVGVEFSKPEMQRIFYNMNPGVKARPWAMGKICNPKGLTTYPDRMYGLRPWRLFSQRQKNGRKPGLYTIDGSDDEMLPNTEEYVHPSVRIRYLYDGRGLDDVQHWTCRSLTKHGYGLAHQLEPFLAPRPHRIPEAFTPFHTLVGGLVPFYDGVGSPGDRVHLHVDVKTPLKYVRTEQPNKMDLLEIDNPTSHWAWKMEDRILPEEALGTWERMYVKINDSLVVWQTGADKRGNDSLMAQREVGRRASAISRYMRNSWNATANNSRPRRKLFKKSIPEKVKPAAFPGDYGYHDITIWRVDNAAPPATRYPDSTPFVLN